ncbi:serine hydrolase [soil metagenome]
MTEAGMRERSDRARSVRPGRHVGDAAAARFDHSFRSLGTLAYDGAQVSASVIDLATSATLVSIDDRVVLPTASIGKVLLLIEVSARMTERDDSSRGILDKTPADLVGESGLWQHLQVPALPIGDLATLVGATSDNVATNLLLTQVGLESVRARAESLGLLHTALLDIVRENRGPDDAPQFSVGSTVELSWLMAALARGEIIDTVTSQRVMGWLANNTDLTLVASAFGLDPLAHRRTDHGVLLVNKTGTDAGVRSEIGALSGPRAALAYAITVQFDDARLAARLGVIDAMRVVGQDLLEYVH